MVFLSDKPKLGHSLFLALKYYSEKRAICMLDQKEISYIHQNSSALLYITTSVALIYLDSCHKPIEWDLTWLVIILCDELASLWFKSFWPWDTLCRDHTCGSFSNLCLCRKHRCLFRFVTCSRMLHLLKSYQFRYLKSSANVKVRGQIIT